MAEPKSRAVFVFGSCSENSQAPRQGRTSASITCCPTPPSPQARDKSHKQAAQGGGGVTAEVFKKSGDGALRAVVSGHGRNGLGLDWMISGGKKKGKFGSSFAWLPADKKPHWPPACSWAASGSFAMDLAALCPNAAQLCAALPGGAGNTGWRSSAWESSRV